MAGTERVCLRPDFWGSIYLSNSFCTHEENIDLAVPQKADEEEMTGVVFCFVFMLIMLVSALTVILLALLNDRWDGQDSDEKRRCGLDSYQFGYSPDLADLVDKRKRYASRSSLNRVGMSRSDRLGSSSGISTLDLLGQHKVRCANDLLSSRRPNYRRVAYASAFGVPEGLPKRVLKKRVVYTEELCEKCLVYSKEESCMHDMCYKCCYQCPSLYLGYRVNKQYPSSLSPLEQGSSSVGEGSTSGCRDALRAGQTCVDRVDLSEKCLVQFPHKLFILGHSCLTVLNLADNQLTTLPDSFELLSNLEEVYLQNNLLQKLPSSLCEIKTLVDLDVGCNELYTLPENMGSLFSLKYLDLSDNNIGWLPVSVCNLSSLYLLDLNGNYLSRLPPAIGSLRALRVLSVSQNKLRSLPCSIGGCINLETIDCANNLIETLPIEMFACHSLAKFNLDNNRLLRVPWQIMNISSSLRELNLKNNRLCTLPTSLFHLCPTLGSFEIQGNPFVQLDEADYKLDQRRTSISQSSLTGIDWTSESLSSRASSSNSRVVPSLAELSARFVLLSGVSYSTLDMTPNMYNRLASAEYCHNACGQLTVLQFTTRFSSRVGFDVEKRVPFEERLCLQCSLRSSDSENNSHTSSQLQ